MDGLWLNAAGTGFPLHDRCGRTPTPVREEEAGAVVVFTWC